MFPVRYVRVFAFCLESTSLSRLCSFLRIASGVCVSDMVPTFRNSSTRNQQHQHQTSCMKQHQFTSSSPLVLRNPQHISFHTCPSFLFFFSFPHKRHHATPPSVLCSHHCSQDLAMQLLSFASCQSWICHAGQLAFRPLAKDSTCQKNFSRVSVASTSVNALPRPKSPSPFHSDAF